MLAPFRFSKCDVFFFPKAALISSLGGAKWSMVRSPSAVIVSLGASALIGMDTPTSWKTDVIWSKMSLPVSSLGLLSSLAGASSDSERSELDIFQNGQTDRQTLDKVIPICNYALPATQKLYVKTRHVLMKHGRPSGSKVKIWQNLLSLTFWPCPKTSILFVILKDITALTSKLTVVTHVSMFFLFNAFNCKCKYTVLL